MLGEIGFEQLNTAFFDTIRLKVDDVSGLKEEANAAKINLNYIDADTVSIAINEATTTSRPK